MSPRNRVRLYISTKQIDMLTRSPDRQGSLFYYVNVNTVLSFCKYEGIRELLQN